MAVVYNLRGTTHESFRISKAGPTIHQGTGAPAASLGRAGDLYVRTNSTPRLYQKDSVGWSQLLSSNAVVAHTEVNYQTAVPDEYVLVNTTGGSKTIVLGTTTTTSGKRITIKDAFGTSGTNPIVIQGQAGQLIDGQVNHTINRPFEAVTLVCDGANWYIL